jgi:CubicO group peptidase (beta-lactamase class C family)
MTKSFTAMAIIKLRDEGRLSLEDPAANYLPELKNLTYLTEDAPQVTIFNLLTMTSGLPEDNPWGDRQLEISDKDLKGLIDEGISFSNVPSFQYEYSNLGYSMLGSIVSRVSGIPYQDYITESILKPLGMQQTRWEYAEIPDTLLAVGYRWENEIWKPEPILHDGAFGAMAGLITSIDDFSKYVSFLLSVWPPQDGPERGPVRRSSVREMQQMFNPKLYTESNGLDGNPCPLMYGYGYGFRVIQDCKDILEVGHGGGLPGFGSNYMIYPDHGIGIISFSNRTYTGSQLYNANFELIEELVEEDLFKPRILPVSNILAQRKDQIMELIESWDPELEKEILADNFYLDKSKEDRMEEVGRILSDAGNIISVGPVIPENQLRGEFILQGESGSVRLHFTLTPERDPKIQEWTLSFH